MRHEKPALAGAMQHHAPTKRQETSSRGGTSQRGKKPHQEVEPHKEARNLTKRWNLTKRQETSPRGGTSPRGKKPRQEVEPHHAVTSKNKRLEPVQLLPVKRLAHWSQKGLRGSLHSHGLLYSRRE